MSNELLWLGFMLLDLGAVLVFFRAFGKYGLYMVMVTSIIVCNIQVMKLVTLFGLPATLGNILYAGLFFSTDILSEVYGKKEAKRGVWLGFAALILAMVYMQVALRFAPAPEDTAQPALEKIFSFFPRVALASLCAYLSSQLHDVWAFHYWKKKTSGRHLWIRNNASTMVSQLIDSAVFCLIAFYRVFPGPVLLEIFVTTYVFKLIVAAADTPFIYWGRRLGRRLPQER
ncbi:MAG TPA: queuosine precursor transporter [bacterium]|nr:queuosine precursor transporter [bacterium]HPQ65834.1 queuosine precursor transporter [bacterium]